MSKRALGIGLLAAPFAGMVVWVMFLFPSEDWLMVYGAMALVFAFIGCAVAGYEMLSRDDPRG